MEVRRTRRSGVLALVVMAVAVVLWSPALAGPAVAASPPTPSPGPSLTQATVPTLMQGDANNGAGIYKRQCEICHDVDAEGDGPGSTLILPPPSNLTAVRDSESMARSIIVKGLYGTAMPAHPLLTDAEVSDLLAFLQTQGLDTTREWQGNWDDVKPDVAQAAAIYAQDCADCHGKEGRGDGDWAKNDYVWPRPADFHARSSTVERTYSLILNGIDGTFMPPETPAISPAACWSLAVFVNRMFSPASMDEVETGDVKQRTNPYAASDRDAWVAGLNAANLYCTYCHGAEVNGDLIAPKLGDREWRYGGGTDTAVFQMVENGAPGKLMPPHPALPEDMRWKIIAYIRYHGGLPAQTNGPQRAGKATVLISGMAFHPATLHVTPGTVVTWVNEDQTVHTATQNDWVDGEPAGKQVPQAWQSGNLSPGAVFSTRIQNTGTYMYQCRIHPYMIGAVLVDQAASTIFSRRPPPGGETVSWWLAVPVAVALGTGLAAWLVLRRRRPAARTASGGEGS